MRVIEKDFMVGGFKVSTYNAYEDIEPELTVMKQGDRVLPAPFFYESGTVFSLVRKWEPGVNQFYINGGFEVRDGGGGTRHYDLDQVIIHPALIKHKATLDLMTRREEKDAAIAQRAIERGEKAPKIKVEGGRRGRPALDPTVKAEREAEVVARAARSGGKRGRPASTVPKTADTAVKTGGKRGRPALTSSVVAQRATASAANRVRTGGKRGRPKTARR